MMRYEVTIHENLEMKVTVEASSIDEAEEIVESRWKNSEYVLTSEDFSDVEFKARKLPDRNREVR
jgi:hypothetical protein